MRSAVAEMVVEVEVRNRTIGFPADPSRFQAAEGAVRSTRVGEAKTAVQKDGKRPVEQVAAGQD